MSNLPSNNTTKTINIQQLKQILAEKTRKVVLNQNNNNHPNVIDTSSCYKNQITNSHTQIIRLQNFNGTPSLPYQTASFNVQSPAPLSFNSVPLQTVQISAQNSSKSSNSPDQDWKNIAEKMLQERKLNEQKAADIAKDAVKSMNIGEDEASEEMGTDRSDPDIFEFKDDAPKMKLIRNNAYDEIDVNDGGNDKRKKLKQKRRRKSSTSQASSHGTPKKLQHHQTPKIKIPIRPKYNQRWPLGKYQLQLSNHKFSHTCT